VVDEDLALGDDPPVAPDGDDVDARGDRHALARADLVEAQHLAAVGRDRGLAARRPADEDQRGRPAEFAQREPLPLDETFAKLRDTVAEAEAVLLELPPAALLETYAIQGYEVSGVRAILHPVAHFAEHTGQILWAVKRLTGKDLGFYAHLDAASGELVWERDRTSDHPLIRTGFSTPYLWRNRARSVRARERTKSGSRSLSTTFMA